MPTNLLRAISNILKIKDYSLSEYYKRGNAGAINRANSMGDALELFVKDAFCGSFGKADK